MKDQKKLMFGIIVAVIIIIGGVVAAGSNKKSDMTTPKTTSSSSSSIDTSTAVATTAVQISNYMFAPMVTKVKVGDTVTWTNMDDVHHNVVADTASADAPNGPLIGRGETYSFKFTKAGTYTYHCLPHTYMHGTIIVE